MSYLNGLVVFPTFFNFSVNFAIRRSWSEPQSALSYFCWLYRASTSLATKNIINLISVLTIWWCPCVESSLVLLEEGVCCDQYLYTVTYRCTLASLSLTISQSLPKFMSIALVMPSTLFSFYPWSFPVSRTFPMSHLFASGDQNPGSSTSALVLPVSIHGWFALRLTGLISLLFKGFSRVFSSTTVRRHQFFGTLPSSGSALTIIHDHWENHNLDFMDLSQQREVSAFQHTVCACHNFPVKKQSSSDFTAAVTIHMIIEPKKRKSVIASTLSLSICHEVTALDAMILVVVVLILHFKKAFSLSSFTLNKRLYSSSSFSAIRVVSSIYMRLLIFPPAILSPACNSSSLAFHMMCSAYKLNKQGDNYSHVNPFPNPETVCCSMSSSVSSWPAYRFLRRQVRGSGFPISLRILRNSSCVFHSGCPI